MAQDLLKEAEDAILVEIKLQNCFREMTKQTGNPKVKAILHDLLLMEEMNEVLLRSLNSSLKA